MHLYRTHPAKQSKPDITAHHKNYDHRASQLPGTVTERKHTIMLRFVVLSAAVILLSEAKNVHHVEKRSSVCYDDLGCFSNDAPFYSQQRPISFLPESPTKINPKFLLYTRQAPTAGIRLKAGDVAGLKASTFRADRPTKLMVHGFIDNTILGHWMQDMTREFLKQGDYNVIIIDWGSGSAALYGQATANTRVVGAMIAQLITFIQTVTGARPEDMHLLGHSLGSHVAGYAGERLRYLGRITGLDPAEPYFQYTDKAVRLDPTDALFVDIIHTDDASFFSTDLGLGLKQPSGHADYYVNGGHDQPGCDKGPITRLTELGILDGIREFIACNHVRTCHVFLESINSKCPFEAFRCATEEEFNEGKCIPCSGEDCGFMGMHADKVKPTRAPATSFYYLKTGGESPYCRYHYKLELTFAATSDSREERGQMYITVRGTGGHTEETKLTADNIYIQPGNTYTFVVTSPVELGDIQDVNFRWDHASDTLDIGSWNLLGLRHPKLYVDKVQVYSGEAQKSRSFCARAVAVETDQTVRISGGC